MTDFPFPIKAGIHIDFNAADIEFKLKQPEKIVVWLKAIISQEKGSVSELNYVFCSDGYLHGLNVEYLDHDTLTDIITFPINLNPIQSDIYISVDRVRENAVEHKQSFETELLRVVAHGLFHLLGYGDKTQSENTIMREKENFALNLWQATE